MGWVSPELLLDSLRETRSLWSLGGLRPLSLGDSLAPNRISAENSYFPVYRPMKKTAPELCSLMIYRKGWLALKVT